jgi:3-methyladenine DNA glycosylase AlkC
MLPASYPEALDILKKVVPKVKGMEAITLPDFVSLYGLDDWDLSLPALGYITRYVTAELAVRPFLDRDPDHVMPFMLKWAEDENKNVRRLASEGCRPRLPWAMALPKFKKDPRPIFPILEKLKNDPSETVRRSVANNLNDISKDNPGLALEVCERWFGQSENTDRIVKHACRTLLKAGDPRALKIFGYCDPGRVKITDFKPVSSALKIGDTLSFSFEMEISGEKKGRVRLEYAVEYQKSGGKTSKKIFKLAENAYAPGRYNFKRKQSFADMSTRKHYSGTHRISIVVNGEIKTGADFELN